MQRSGQAANKEAEAVKFYRKGCASGDAMSCSDLGVRYAKGIVVARDDVEAARLFRKACDGGEPVAKLFS